ncbi:uncharacterized protein LOC132193917 [Neocloeon triangulifer]|uniref:uncharacterized protein LOC132193917 n=1 Tax=Neocloeon triangulifer TaxID=2078957 RepID=UPI00286F13E4|nr:uncharacterized protein LOC132193917 [Neocloeon triangulifer]
MDGGYEDVAGPSTRNPLPRRVNKKKKSCSALIVLKVAFVLCALSYVVGTCLVNYLLVAKVCTNLRTAFEKIHLMTNETDQLNKSFNELAFLNDEVTKEKNLLQGLLLNATKENDVLKKEVQMFRIPPTFQKLSNGKIYHFAYPTQANWIEAKERCATMGLRLASLKNLTDLKVIFNKTKEIHENSWWFVSARNYGNQNQSDFKWLDGSRLESNSSMWHKDADKKLGCTEIITNQTDKLHGGKCSDKHHFVCEFEFPTKSY